jgi:hypothetical protein
VGIGDKVEGVERGLWKLIFGARGAGEPLRIRRDILTDVESHIEPVGRSRKAFPYNYLAIRILTGDERDRAVKQSIFKSNDEVRGQILDHLARAGCELPARLRVELEFTSERGAEWRQEFFNVEYGAVGSGKYEAGQPQPAGHKVTAARVIVLDGVSAQKEVVIDKARFNIGRMPEVLDQRKCVVRRNDLVFIEGAAEVNRTVSRSHAHIRFDREAGELRIFDDQSAYGTRIRRAGADIEVASSNTLGNRLHSGDELLFGRARVRFEII